MNQTHIEELENLVNAIGQVLLGKEEVIKKTIMAMLADGHVLIEDVPGVGKTTLVKALALAVGGSFARIQFTPDTMPGDVTGVSVYNMQKGNFEVVLGPVMNQFVLADELNRTSPKTQASLLEAMAEKQVTIDGKSYKLPEAFMVIATQNPIEQSGTYVLPEAELDRFMIKLSVGYPDAEQEKRMVTEHKQPEMIENVISVDRLLEIKKEVASVKINDATTDYIVRIVNATRKSEDIKVGASPRATLALAQMSRSQAYMNGRNYVIPDDIKAVAQSVLAHRIILSKTALAKGYSQEEVVADVMRAVAIPVIGQVSEHEN